MRTGGCTFFLLLLFSASAMADGIQYTFNSRPGDDVWSFSLTSPTFITIQEGYLDAAQSRCAWITGPYVDCNVRFRQAQPDPFPNIAMIFLFPNHSVSLSAFYFPSGFSVFGEFDSIDNGNRGHLSVRAVVGDFPPLNFSPDETFPPPPMPEPNGALLFATGMGFILWSAFRRRTTLNHLGDVRRQQGFGQPS